MLAEVVIGMTTEEARFCVDEIKAHVGKARARLLDLYQRQGWLVLGYGSWRECVEREFGQSQRYLYYQLQAAITEQNLCTIVQNHAPIPESHLRPLSLLSPEKQVDVWQRAVETAPDGKITAAHVQSVVDEITNKPHVSFNTGENEWYTPPEYIEAALSVLGGIDLDPASSQIANLTVQAAEYFTKDDDGLVRDWRGRIWMNPPYSKDLIGKFASKFALHSKAGDITGIVLVNNATETRWFNELVEVSQAILFTTGRIAFLDPDGNPGAPLQGQAVIYCGNSPDRFLAEFSRFGWGARL